MNFRSISKFFIIFFFVSNVLGAQNSTVVPGNIIVMLHSNEETQKLSELLSHVNGISTHLKVKSTLSKNMNIFLFEFDSISINPELMLNIIKACPLVKIAQFNHTVQLRNTPSDSLFYAQWNMNNTGQNGGTAGADIDALKAWDITTGGLTAQGDTIVVAVVDEGFDQQHEDLNFWKNHHEIPNNNIDDDNNGYVDDYNGWNSGTFSDNLPVADHGTHICGIIGAKGCNRIGVAGVNWNIKIMPVSIDSQSEANIVGAYTYVLEQRRLYNQTNGAKGAFVVVTSSSFGLDRQYAASHPLWCAMYDSLGSVGILSAGATSNNNYNVDTQGDMPTTCPSNWLIAVTNTTDTDAKATAGYGATMIDLGAPGTDIPSTLPSNSYGLMSGTSMATPHVAGTVALMYSVGCAQFMADCKNNPAAMALIIKDSLLSAVDTVSSLKGKTVTGGRLNLNKAVRSILHYYPNDSCITNPPMPTITVSNDILTSSSATGNQWYLNGIAISGATGQTYIVTKNGDYTDVVTIKGLSSPVSNTITISNFVTGFSIKKVYPNPTNGILNISYACDEDNAVVNLYNMMGEKIESINVSKSNIIQTASFDLTTVAEGFYFVNMSNHNARSNSFKVIVAPKLLKP